MKRRTLVRSLALALFTLVHPALPCAASAAAARGSGTQSPGADAPRVTSHVRTVEGHLRNLLQQGALRSPTFGGLLEALDSSDVVVYVESATLNGPAVLVFAAATSSARFLRIRVRATGRPDTEVIGWLGHELQHALEIAAAPEVRDQQGVLALYRRIGLAGRSTCETKSAQDIAARILDEVRYGRQARGR